VWCGRIRTAPSAAAATPTGSPSTSAGDESQSSGFQRHEVGQYGSEVSHVEYVTVTQLVASSSGPHCSVRSSASSCTRRRSGQPPRARDRAKNEGGRVCTTRAQLTGSTATT
jgi:hypothetical protein